MRGPYHGAIRNTQTYLVMTHDNSGGRMYLEDDRLRIDWPGVGEQPIFQRVNDLLKQATVPLGGTYVKNPIWSQLFKHNLITVHPLGGCRMAENAENGVVNHQGQVFSGKTGAAVYDSLYVCDGSIMPRSLGVNPLADDLRPGGALPGAVGPGPGLDRSITSSLQLPARRRRRSAWACSSPKR